jgi:hypothetical protein
VTGRFRQRIETGSKPEDGDATWLMDIWKPYARTLTIFELTGIAHAMR